MPEIGGVGRIQVIILEIEQPLNDSVDGSRSIKTGVLTDKGLIASQPASRHNRLGYSVSLCEIILGILLLIVPVGCA